MAWLISVLGAALALAGAASLFNGISYLRLDWGATEAVAGTVALSGGLVILALGAVLFALRDLPRRCARAASVRVGTEALTGHDDEAGSGRPVMRRITSKLAVVGMPKAGPTQDASSAEAVPDRPSVEPPGFAPTLRASFPAEEPEPPPPAGPDPVPAPGTSQQPLPVADAPTVVGRYQANGASYVLFSDGTIEVETESGIQRFASMADLRDHIERKDAG